MSCVNNSTRATVLPAAGRTSGPWALLLALGWLAGCATDRPAASTAASATLPSTPRPSGKPAPPSGPGTNAPAWISLFDGRTMTGWKESDFAGHGEITVEDGKLILGSGVMTGVTWTNDLPRMNYEIALDAMRVDGSDFFCGLTFPVGEDPCSLIVGGWGGGVVGLSSLDGADAANNETTSYMHFENGRWFAIRVRVLPRRIQAWIDNDLVVDADTTDRKTSIRIEVEASKPLGISTWSTTSALKNIRLRKL